MIQIGTPILPEALSDSKVNLGNPDNPVNAVYTSGGSGTVSDLIWTRVSGNIYPNTITDKLSLGTTTFIGSERLRILGETNTDTIRSANAYIDTLRLRSSTYYSNISGALTATRTLTIPDATGTIALTSDLPSNKTLLETYTNSNVNISTAISYAHLHSNISTLDGIAGTDITNWNNAFSWGDHSLSGYLTAETDPIFVASVAHAIVLQDFVDWTTAYGWGNHATYGYLTNETDPVFTASVAYNITGFQVSSWNVAYAASHGHTNYTLLDSLISTGFGTQFLSDDGTYKAISATVPGSNTEVVFNNAGSFGATASVTIGISTGLLSATDLLTSDHVYYGDTTAYIRNVGGNLTFYDSIVGTTTTLDVLVTGATNQWGVASGGIYYGTGANKVGINTSTLTEALTVIGNISATDFNSNKYRYDTNSNILIGTDIIPTGSNKLYIDNNALGTSSTYPLVYGDFLSRFIEINGELTLNYGILSFEDYNQRIYSNSGVLYITDLSIGTPIPFYNFIDGTYNALKADFAEYATTTAITAANVSQWNTAYSQRHIHVDNILDWDGTTGTYKPFATKQGTTLSFDTSIDAPTGTTRLNLNGDLHTTTLNVAGKLTVGGLIDPTGLQLTPVATNPGDIHTIWEDSDDSLLKYGSNIIYTGLSSTSTIGALSDTDWDTFNSKQSGHANLTSLAGLSYVSSSFVKMTGADTFTLDTATYEPSLGNPGTTGYVLSSTDAGVRSWVAMTSGVTPTDDILDWSTDKYIPYATRAEVGTNLSFYSENVVPNANHTGALVLNGKFIAGSTNSSYNSTAIEGRTYGGIGVRGEAAAGGAGVLGQTTTGSGCQGTVTSTGYGLVSRITGSSVTTAKGLFINRDSSGASSTGDLILITDDPSSGTISGKVLSATIGATERISLNPRQVDTGSNIAYLFDTHNLLSGSSTRVLSIKNNSDGEVLGITGSGTTITKSLKSGYIGGNDYTEIETDGTLIGRYHSTTKRFEFKPGVADGASAVGYLFDTSSTLSTAGSKLLSIQNNTVERFRVTPTTTDIGDIAGGNKVTITSGDLTSSGSITPGGRLLIPMGEVSYFSTTGTSITISGTSDGSTNTVVVNPTTSLDNDMEFDNGGADTGRLRYIGTTTRTFHVACTISYTAAVDNQNGVFGVAKNGTVVAASKILPFLGLTTDTRSTALHSMVSLATNDYLELYVGNTTASNNVTIKTLNLFAMGM